MAKLLYGNVSRLFREVKLINTSKFTVSVAKRENCEITFMKPITCTYPFLIRKSSASPTPHILNGLWGHIRDTGKRNENI